MAPVLGMRRYNLIDKVCFIRIRIICKRDLQMYALLSNLLYPPYG